MKTVDVVTQEDLMNTSATARELGIMDRTARHVGIRRILLYSVRFYFAHYTAEFGTRIKGFLKPNRESLQHFLTNYQSFWRIVNNISWLRNFIMKTVLKGKSERARYGEMRFHTLAFYSSRFFLEL